MNKLIVGFCILLSLLLNLFCKENQSNPNVNGISRKINLQEYILKIKDTSITKICFTNPYKTKINIAFQLNHKFWFSKDQLINNILKQDIEKIPKVDDKIYKAWVFIILNTFHQPPLELNLKKINNPLEKLNSIGSGFCVNRAICLARIWSALGFQCRIVHLGGHAVPEVYDRGHWKMFDPDNGLFFTDSLGNIASVDEIVTLNNSLIIDTSRADEFNQLLNIFVNKKQFFDLFTTTENNFIDTTEIKNFYPEQTYLSLPPNAKFEFPVFNSDAYKYTNYNFCRLTIPNQFSGLISIPFVIHHIEGNGFLMDDMANIYYGNKNFPIASGLYYLKCDSMKIYAYINPLLMALNNTNSIKILSSDSLFPVVSFSKNEIRFVSKSELKVKMDEPLFQHINPYIQFFSKWPEKDSLNISNIQEFKNYIYFVCRNISSENFNKKRLDEKIDDFFQQMQEAGFNPNALFKVISEATIFKLLAIINIESLPAAIEKHYFNALIYKLRSGQKNNRN